MPVLKERKRIGTSMSRRTKPKTVSQTCNGPSVFSGYTQQVGINEQSIHSWTPNSLLEATKTTCAKCNSLSVCSFFMQVHHQFPVFTGKPTARNNTGRRRMGSLTFLSVATSSQWRRRDACNENLIETSTTGSPVEQEASGEALKDTERESVTCRVPPWLHT